MAALRSLLSGIELEPWQPLKCDEIEYEDQNEDDDEIGADLMMNGDDNLSECDKCFQIKYKFNNECIAVLITDLLQVWYCEQSKSDILSMQKELNAVMAQNTNIEQINDAIYKMLCLTNERNIKISFDNVEKKCLTLNARTKIANFIDFEWRCSCLQYGSSADQAILLKQHLILPLMNIANEMAQKLHPNAQKNENCVFEQKMTETFLQFDLSSIQFKESYKQSMEYLTFSQMGGNDDICLSLNGLKKRKKRPLNASISAYSESSNNKKRKISNKDEMDSDDEVLRGLKGRESELKMNEFDDQNKNDEMETLDAFGDTNDCQMETQQQRNDEMKRRQELKEKLERNKKDKKKQKKKKKKKLRI